MSTASEPAAARLKIAEIFKSLQGEADSVGFPTTFVRLTGCPLRCQYCDTAYAFTGGQWQSIPSIMASVADLGTHHVCVTGGEPLAQGACADLLSQLCESGYRVSLETSGAMALSAVDARVVKIVDIKTPGSGEVQRNRYEELAHLTAQDQLKFVICSRDDYEWSKAKVAELKIRGSAVLFSPSFTQLPARELADWILADGLSVRMQIQLHKYLWGDVPGK
jgi:7-carboxy-7-deazaguanine synthase